jgi:hypothetical protein
MPRSVHRYDIISPSWSSTADAILGDGVMAGDGIGGTNKEDGSIADGIIGEGNTGEVNIDSRGTEDGSIEDGSIEDGSIEDSNIEDGSIEDPSIDVGGFRPRTEPNGARTPPNTEPGPRSGSPLTIGSDGAERTDDNGRKIGDEGAVALACARTLDPIVPRLGFEIDGRGSCCDETIGRIAEGLVDGTLGAELGSPSRLPKTAPGPKLELGAKRGCELLRPIGTNVVKGNVGRSREDNRREELGMPNKLPRPAPRPETAAASSES